MRPVFRSFIDSFMRLPSLSLAACLFFGLPAAAAASPFAYITNTGSGNVSVIDTASNTIAATVAVGSSPYGVSVNPAGTRVYVPNYGSNNVSVIDTSTNTVTATIAVGNNPYGAAVNPAGTRLFVANAGSNSVSIVDTSTNTVTATVAVGSFAYGIAFNPAGTRAYVTNLGSSSVSVIDTTTNTVTATVATGTSPGGITVNPAGTRAYVSNQSSNSVTVIDTSTNTVVTTIAVGNLPAGIAVNSSSTRLYVANQNTNNVSVVDTSTNTVVGTVSVGTQPRGVSLTTSGASLYVSNQGSNNVSVVNTTTNAVTATVAVNSSPNSFGVFIVAPPVTSSTTTSPSPAIPPLGTLPNVAGVGNQPTVLDLSNGNGPSMTTCLIGTVRSLFGADAVYLGQSASGAGKISQGGRIISFYPINASTNSTVSADIHLGSSNVLTIGTSCGDFDVVPAIYNLADFGSVLNSMGLVANVNAQGVITIVSGSTVYVGRPDYLVNLGTPGTPSLAMGADGLYRFKDSAGNVQILRPAFLDTEGLAGSVQQALSLGGWTTIQTDGSALFSAFNGQQYVFTPDLTLTTAPAENSSQFWWKDSANHYLFRTSLLTQAQGFTVR